MPNPKPKMPGRASMSADADDNWSVCTSFSVCLSFSVGLSPSRRTVRRVRRGLGAGSDSRTLTVTSYLCERMALRAGLVCLCSAAGLQVPQMGGA